MRRVTEVICVLVLFAGTSAKAQSTCQYQPVVIRSCPVQQYVPPMVSYPVQNSCRCVCPTNNMTVFNPVVTYSSMPTTIPISQPVVVYQSPVQYGTYSVLNSVQPYSYPAIVIDQPTLMVGSPVAAPQVSTIPTTTNSEIPIRQISRQTPVPTPVPTPAPITIYTCRVGVKCVTTGSCQVVTGTSTVSQADAQADLATNVAAVVSNCSGTVEYKTPVEEVDIFGNSTWTCSPLPCAHTGVCSSSP